MLRSTFASLLALAAMSSVVAAQEAHTLVPVPNAKRVEFYPAPAVPTERQAFEAGEVRQATRRDNRLRGDESPRASNAR